MFNVVQIIQHRLAHTREAKNPVVAQFVKRDALSIPIWHQWPERFLENSLLLISVWKPEKLGSTPAAAVAE